MYFEAYFIDWNFSPNIWQKRNAFDQPKLSELLYGFWTRVWYQQDLDQLFLKTDFNQGWSEEKNYYGWWSQDKWWIKFSGNYPQSKFIPEKWQAAYQIIIINRYLSLIFGLACLGMMFLIGKQLLDFWLGLFCLVILALNPLFYQVSRQALADTHLLFFLLFGLYLFLKKSRLILIILASGLAVSAKLNGIITSLLFIFWNMFQINKNSIKTILVIIVGSFLIFVLLNPYTWPNPPLKTFTMFVWRNWEAHNFQKWNQNVAYVYIWDRPFWIFKETVLPSARFSSLRAINSYLDLLLFLTGIMSIIKLTNQKKIKKFIFWAVGTLIFMTLYLTVGIDRYFLPMIPIMIIIEALGAKYLCQKAINLLTGFLPQKIY